MIDDAEAKPRMDALEAELLRLVECHCDSLGPESRGLVGIAALAKVFVREVSRLYPARADLVDALARYPWDAVLRSLDRGV